VNNRRARTGSVILVVESCLALAVGQWSWAGTDASPAVARGCGLNAFSGMTEREEIFEFAEKPAVIRQGDKVAIAFTSKGACDATVAIAGPNGRVVRHLASGVLGKNAPRPFRQNSLSQKIEWDGKDDDGNPAPAGAKAKVSLGLDAKFEKIDAWALLLGIRPLAVGKDSDLYAASCGLSGAVYVVQPWKPSGQKLPDGLAAGGSYEDSRWASLIKFPGNFEKFPVGRIEGAWEPSPANSTHEGDGMKIKADGALWTYGGVSPHSAKYRSCTCMKASADLDDYERSFVCAAQTCSINVIDSNGNVMARLGSYGNVDDLMAGKKLTFSLPRNVAATDDTMWVVDLDYRALVRTKLGYRAEEMVGAE
jgi:hypothetical protein